MKKRELHKLGIPEGALLKQALAACGEAAAAGRSKTEIRETMRALAERPEDYTDDEHFGGVAAGLREKPAPHAADAYDLRADLDYAVWGEDIDPSAHEQMRNACRLPVSTAAALMPDAHVGYGLPIGGVLATENAVIPYAVGVDIACRVKMTVFDLPPQQLVAHEGRFERILERDTLFGVGGNWRRGREPAHDVMDENWNVTPVTRQLKDKAWKQLGTSGSGNHFVEFGELELGENPLGAPPGRYLAVVSHSGSRGSGAAVCSHYSKAARDLHPHLPRELLHLAWLPMDGLGAEYWAAMELMGRYASANHAVIHDKLIRSVGARVVAQVENHHNFAWKEMHGGREVIVHRKGATPAGRGVLGYIPGTMVAPGYLIEGLGDPRSLDSASHGAGRCMSRKKAKSSFRWSHVKSHLREHGIKLLSAGLDEAPQAYKSIDEVMAAQASLVRAIGRFQPRMVKMAPDGERPED